nr:hypothetical protein Itr_chr05CG25020 [Ipomoea trifida]
MQSWKLEVEHQLVHLSSKALAGYLKPYPLAIPSPMKAFFTSTGLESPSLSQGNSSVFSPVTFHKKAKEEIELFLACPQRVFQEANQKYLPINQRIPDQLQQSAQTFSNISSKGLPLGALSLNFNSSSKSMASTSLIKILPDLTQTKMRRNQRELLASPPISERPINLMHLNKKHSSFVQDCYILPQLNLITCHTRKE